VTTNGQDRENKDLSLTAILESKIPLPFANLL